MSDFKVEDRLTAEERFLLEPLDQCRLQEARDKLGNLLIAEREKTAELKSELEKSNKLYFNDQKHFEKKVTENKKLKDLLRKCPTIPVRKIIIDEYRQYIGEGKGTYSDWLKRGEVDVAKLLAKFIDEYNAWSDKITATLEEKP